MGTTGPQGAQGPAGPAGPSNVLQSAFARATTDKSTASTTPVDLPELTLALVTSALSKLCVWFSVSGQNANANSNLRFQLLVDGAVKVGAMCRIVANGVPNSAGLCFQVLGLAAGAHVVKIQWSVSAGTGNIQALSDPTQQHASLMVQEVTV
jgi:hypothetical protein